MRCVGRRVAIVSTGAPSIRRSARRPADATGDLAGAHAVHTLVDALPGDQRTAFVLTQIVGCSYAEAASVCGVPIGTIRSRVARAREQLIDDLRDADTG